MIIGNIATNWKLSEIEMSEILGISTKEYSKLISGDYQISGALEDRVSDLIRIHKGLRLLFVEPERGYAWIKKANTNFDNLTAAVVMKSDIKKVRDYIEAEVYG